MTTSSPETYAEAIEFLYQLKPGKIAFGLQNTIELCAAMGNPQDGPQYIHVAGTNGKGSTVSTIHSILQKAGLSCGLYTSPHLVEFRERIRLNDDYISESELVEGVARLFHARERLKARGIEPTFFEATTALAFDWFNRKGAQIVVLETGMGGRLDSTNIITPMVSVITDIAFDHEAYLGDTLAKIAGEKAGIIKNGVPVFAAPAVPEVEKVFREKAAGSGSHLEFVVPAVREGISRYPLGQTFSFDGEEYFTPLLGAHQLRNVSLALRVALHLQATGWNISDDAIREGVRSTCWPGRFEVLSQNPWLVLDGGHNPQGMERTLETWNDVVGQPPGRILLGVLRDKDVDRIIGMVEELPSEIWLLPIHSHRASNPVELQKHFKKTKPRVFDSVAAALLENGQVPHAGGALIAGSLYLAGEVLACMKKQISESRVNG